MKKKQRILKNHEFSRFIARKKTVRSPGFLLYYLPRAQEKARLGISVSKKIGNAVTRNRIKRQIRSMADRVFDFDGPFDAILIVRRDYLKQTFAQNESELVRLLQTVDRNFHRKRKKKE